MKKIGAGLLLSFFAASALAQPNEDNTLLWKISGNGIEKPSYLFGTIHLICSDDALLSENMKKAISNCDEVYFEVDIDNIVETIGVMGKMKMQGDTTLKDLLTIEQYQKVKRYFEKKGSMLPFSILETFKPILAASTLEQSDLPCDNASMMEQVIMKEAKKYDKQILGLETMAYQAGVLDSIPYKLQAEQLLEYIDRAGKGGKEEDELAEMFRAYKNQDLQKLESLMKNSDAGMSAFTDIMLYHRNQNWVEKLKTILPAKSVLIAVGAGHLPGDKGVINLLRKEGYKLTPVDNKVKKPGSEI
jgi:uncharacterized protein YbaP (TraB family)